MRGLGMSRAEIAAEMARQYKLRPRTAWRIAWGWTLEESAERYNALRARGAPEAVTSLTGSRLSEWENWPFSTRKPSITGLCLLAEIYQCGVLDLTDVQDREKLPAAELLTLGKAIAIPMPRRDGYDPEIDTRGTGIPASPATVLGSMSRDVMAQDSRTHPGTVLSAFLAAASRRPTLIMPEVTDIGAWIDVGELVMAAAEESGECAAQGAGMLVPEPRVEQVQADVRRLARTYSATPPLAFLADTRSVRDQACRLAERTRRPGQIAGLYTAAGQACALMSVASFDLAVWPAAIEQAHAALTFAEMADHPALQGWARGMQGLIAYWCARPQDAVQAVDAGLFLAPPGTARARLYCISARAWSHLGSGQRTREALAAADRERDLIGDAGGDELHDGIGGEFGWGPARQAMCSASALLRIDDPDGAAAQAAEAIRLHPADQSGSLVDMTARADLARAELARGRLDAAQDALDPVWSLPAEHRRYSLVGRLEGVASALAAPRYLNAAVATAITERINAFADDTAPRTLPAAASPSLPRGE
jgi:hypothetical protein